MSKQKTQILYIHGGMTFKNKKDYIFHLKHRSISIKKENRWSGEYLTKNLHKQFEIIRPRMPLGDNARYTDWAIHLKRYYPLLRNNIILIGESLGGVFLAKFLSENRFPKKIHSVYLVCAPFDNTLPGEDLVGGFTLKSDLSLLEKNTKNLYLFFSKYDDVVPVSHAKKYATKLKKARITVYENIRGHFDVAEFPDIIKLIRKIK